MSILSVIKKIEVLIWGVLSHLFQIIPEIVPILNLLGFGKIAQTMAELEAQGGLAADEYIDEHRQTMLDGADYCDQVAAWFHGRAAIMRDIVAAADAPRDPDALTVDEIADFTRRLLDQDALLQEIQDGGKAMHPALTRAVVAAYKVDHSLNPNTLSGDTLA